MARSRKITQKMLLEGDPREALRLKLIEVRADRDAARATGKAWTTVASLHRLECDLLRQLTEVAQTPAPDALDTLSDEELEALATGASGEEGDADPAPPLRLVGR